MYFNQYIQTRSSSVCRTTHTHIQRAVKVAKVSFICPFLFLETKISNFSRGTHNPQSLSSGRDDGLLGFTSIGGKTMNYGLRPALSSVRSQSFAAKRRALMLTVRFLFAAAAAAVYLPFLLCLFNQIIRNYLLPSEQPPVWFDLSCCCSVVRHVASATDFPPE